MTSTPTKNRRFLDMSITEAHFQRDVESLLKQFGWAFYHTRDSRKSNAGFPDLVAIRCLGNGDWRMIFVELKTEQGRVSLHQKRWLAALDRMESVCGGHVLARLWRPSQLDEIVEMLR